MSQKRGRFEDIDLIELIEERTALWDKTCEDFKDKNKKDKLWKEIASFLSPEYDNLNEKDKQSTEENIRSRWRNITDAFKRSVKTKSGQSASKKYLYHDQLKFYMKIIDKDITEASLENDAEENEEDSIQIIKVRAKSDDSSKKNLKTKISPNIDREEELLNILKQPPKEMDEDEAFFMSVLPSVRKLSEDQKFKFRMGVMSLIQKVKYQDQQSFSFPSNSSHSSSGSLSTWPTENQNDIAPQNSNQYYNF